MRDRIDGKRHASRVQAEGTERAGHGRRRQGGQEIGGGQNGRDDREVGHPSSDRSPEPGGCGGDIDRALELIADADDQVRPARPGPGAPFAERRVAAAGEASPFQRPDILGRDTRGQPEPGGRYGDVDLSLRDFEQHGLARTRPFDRNAGRRGAQIRQQVGEEGERKIGRRQPEDAARACRLESVTRGQHPFDAPQQGAHLFDELQRESSGFHAPAAFDQQRIAQLIAQARQRMADGRLGPPQPLGRPCDAAVAHQHLEDGEQVEVEALQIDLIHEQSQLRI